MCSMSSLPVCGAGSPVEKRLVQRASEEHIQQVALGDGEAHYPTGKLEPTYSGCGVQWLRVQWLRGAVVTGCSGYGVQWLRGAVVTGCSGYGVQWLRGAVVMGCGGYGVRWRKPCT